MRPLAARARLVSEAHAPGRNDRAWADFRRSGRMRDDRCGARRGRVCSSPATSRRRRWRSPSPSARRSRSRTRRSALVTPDRALARRVAVELGRWDLVVDNSAGAPLDRLPPGVFARLLAEALAEPAEPVTAARAPQASLRGFRHGAARLPQGGPHPRAGAVPRPARPRRHRRARRQRSRRRVPRPRPKGHATSRPPATPLDRDWDARRKRSPSASPTILGPLEAAFAANRRRSPPPLSAQLLLEALAAAATDDKTARRRALRRGRRRGARRRCFAGLAGESGDARGRAGANVPAFLATLMARRRGAPGRPAPIRASTSGARSRRGSSRSISSSSAASTRGVWPAETRTDPWLSRSMRTEIGLPPPERRIGLAAHDFAEALRGAARHRHPRRKARRRADGRVALAAAADRAARRGRRPQRCSARRALRRARPRTSTASSRTRPAGRTAEADAAGRGAPAPAVGHRDRDAGPRSLRDLRQAHPPARAARSARPRARLRAPRLADPRRARRLRRGMAGTVRRARAEARLLAIGRETLAEIDGFPGRPRHLVDPLRGDRPLVRRSGRRVATRGSPHATPRSAGR